MGKVRIVSVIALALACGSVSVSNGVQNAEKGKPAKQGSTKSVANETTRSQNPPSYRYPDIPRYYPNSESKDRIELLTEAADDQEIVAWADKNHLPRIVKPKFAHSLILVFTQYSGKQVMLKYDYNYNKVHKEECGCEVEIPDESSQKPLKLQFAGQFDGVDAKDDVSLMYEYYTKRFACRSTPKATKFEPIRGFDYSYPCLPKQTDWTVYKGYFEALPRAKSRQEIVEMAKNHESAYYWQLDEPFNRLFVVVEPIGFGVSYYRTYIYGDLGKGPKPWVLLCVVGPGLPEGHGGFDGEYVYVDNKTGNLIFSGGEDGASGYIDIENELKMVYGDRYKAIMDDAKPK